ncbi:MAG: hypothetical protein AB7O48_17275 [Cyclobacteriaceae bacterium]
MKNLKFISLLAIALFITVSCEQEVIVAEPPVVDTPDPGPDPVAGSVSFTKFVAIGNSFVAGVQGGALFTDGQNNSLAAILNKQFETVGAPATFNQPTIGASLGFNLFLTQPVLGPPFDPTKPVLGRLLLQTSTTPDCKTGAFGPRPTPQAYAAGMLEAVPNPTANPGFIYTGGKATLNNFGVPAIVLGQALIPETGAWAGAGVDPRFSPFYGRLAFPGTGTSTIIGDAAAAGGSFFLFYLGLDDFFLHAAFGGDPAKAPLTTNGAFAGQYNAAIGALLGSNANLKGVVGNFPDIFKMPHFTSVAYNPIPLDATTAAAVGAGFAGYNTALDGLSGALTATPANFGLTAEQAAGLVAELATRKVTFTASCENKALIADETLTNLGPFFDGMLAATLITSEQRAGLTPYQQVRQTTPTDILPLGAGSVLGTTVGGNPLLVNGVSVPLADQYVLIPSEIEAIKAARASFNASIAATVAANTSRLALADIDAAMVALVSAGATVQNGVTITPNINPPTGMYSEDGVHPNSRGYAFLSRVFIQAINAKFGSTIPLTDVSLYSATGLPIP